MGAEFGLKIRHVALPGVRKLPAFFVEFPVIAASAGAFHEQFGGFHAVQSVECGGEGGADGFDGFFGGPVCAAGRFVDNFIDEAQFFESGGGDAEDFGGFGGAAGIFPEDGGATFGGDDGIDGVAEHADVISGGECECAAGAAFADNGGEDGGLECGGFPEAHADGAGLSAFFGADSGVGAGGIDEGEDGHLEFFGEFHNSECFAVAFGPGHSEVAPEFSGGSGAFLVSDDGDGASVKRGESGDDGAVVGVVAVAVEFGKFFAHAAHIIEHLGAFGVPGDLADLPVVQFGVEFFEFGVAFFSERPELFDGIFSVGGFFGVS